MSVVAAAPAARASHEPGHPDPAISAAAGKNEFDVLLVDVVHATPSQHAADEDGQSATEPELPYCDGGPASGDCTPVTICMADPTSPTGHTAFVSFGHQGGSSGLAAAGPCDPNRSPGPSLPNAVLRAFQRIPLPEPQLAIQPPKGKTLIGLETILSTEANPFTRTLTLLGRRVDLRIHASSFDWVHGDGTTQTTDWPGRAWQRGVPIERYVTYVYENTGPFTPSVRVTWSADYRVANGPWQPVNGTVERTSAPAQLQVLEAEPKLVAP
jgi:hypothetical protein